MVGAVVSARDITERKHAEEKLLQEIEDRKALEKQLRAQDEEFQEVNIPDLRYAQIIKEIPNILILCVSSLPDRLSAKIYLYGTIEIIIVML